MRQNATFRLVVPIGWFQETEAMRLFHSAGPLPRKGISRRPARPLHAPCRRGSRRLPVPTLRAEAAAARAAERRELGGGQTKAMSSTIGVDHWVPELAVAPPSLPPRRPRAQYYRPEQPVGGSNSDAAINLRSMIPEHCCASWIHANPPRSVQATGQTASPDDAPRAVADIGRNGLRDSQNERKAYGLLAPAHTNNAFVQMGVEAANKMGLAYVVRAFEPGAWPGVLELPAPPTPSTSGAIKSAKPEVCVPRRTMASKQRVQPLRSKMPVSSPCCTPEKPKKARPTIESLIGMILAVCLVTAIVAALLWPSAEHDTGLARLSRRVLGTHAAQGKGPEKRNRSVKTLLFPLAGRNIESRQLLRAYEQELLRRGLGVST